VGTEALAAALLAHAPYALVLADARTAALLAFAPLAIVGTDALAAAVLAQAPVTLVGTEPHRIYSFDAGGDKAPSHRTPCTCSFGDDVDRAPSHRLAFTPLTLVWAEARHSAVLALASLELVRTLGDPPLDHDSEFHRSLSSFAALHLGLPLLLPILSKHGHENLVVNDIRKCSRQLPAQTRLRLHETQSCEWSACPI
jgi:hypothetical protein